ncbi:hypothetical protein VPH35_040538 [Triticum aestivum]
MAVNAYEVCSKFKKANCSKLFTVASVICSTTDFLSYPDWLCYEGEMKIYLRWRRAAVGACGAAVCCRQSRRLKLAAALSPLRGNGIHGNAVLTTNLEISVTKLADLSIVFL